jgi:hypothetical protein
MLRKMQPISLMSANELEEPLPYVAENAFGWTRLLRSRLIETEAGTFSVHQAILGRTCLNTLNRAGRFFVSKAGREDD